MTERHATIGDALIFMTKAIVGSSVLLIIAILAAGVWGFMVWSDGKRKGA